MECNDLLIFDEALSLRLFLVLDVFSELVLARSKVRNAISDAFMVDRPLETGIC